MPEQLRQELGKNLSRFSKLWGRSEWGFRRLLEKLPAGAYICDPDGLITYFNPRAVAIWGRAPKLNAPEDRFCGSFKLFSSNGSPIPHDRCWMALALRENTEYDGHEIVIERPDGYRLTALAYASPFRDESGKLLGAVNLLVDVSDRKQAELERERLFLELDNERARLKELAETLEERVVQRTAQVRNLAAALSLAEQRERARIAQVLHDDLQQLLYSQRLRLEALRHRLPPELQVSLADLIGGMTEQIDQAVHVSRTLVTELNPPPMATDHLSEALQWLASHMQEAHGLQVELTAHEPGEIRDAETRGVLLQMISELLFNVVKHADTDRAGLELYREHGHLLVCVKDHGVGFDAGIFPTAAKGQPGFGLSSIAERLAMIGGCLSVESAPGTGTRVIISIPAQ